MRKSSLLVPVLVTLGTGLGLAIFGRSSTAAPEKDKTGTGTGTGTFKPKPPVMETTQSGMLVPRAVIAIMRDRVKALLDTYAIHLLTVDEATELRNSGRALRQWGYFGDGDIAEQKGQEALLRAFAVIADRRVSPFGGP